MNSLKTILLLCFSAVAFSGCVQHSANSAARVPSADIAQNVIFLIGDGMGLAQVTAAIKVSKEPLNLQSAEIVGLINTSSALQEITDSAAGATAFSIGEKTANGAVGMDVNGHPKETLLELLAGNGYATGVIATSTITHATPASFYAHVDSRENYYKIAEDLIQSPVTLFIGGGEDHFDQRDNEKRGTPDTRNLLKEFSADGGTLIKSIEELKQQNGRVGYLIADDSPKPSLEGRGDILVRSISPSIDYLQSQSSKGFFMMVEGSQIDWGGHQNKFEYANSELIDFDAALGEALRFARADGNTLVVVTADHETGGLTLPTSDIESEDPYSNATHDFSTIGHTATMVPVYAFGKGAKNFAGVYQNKDIYSKILRAMGKQQ